MLNYRINNGNGYLEINGVEVPFTPLEALDKRQAYVNGIYIADRAWTKKASSIISELKRITKKNYDNVVIIDFAKEKAINTPSQVIEYINKQRKKDYSDPEVVRSMTINRDKDASSVIMAKYERCYVFLENVEKMDGFEPQLLADLAAWNCAVYLDCIPKY